MNRRLLACLLCLTSAVTAATGPARADIVFGGPAVYEAAVGVWWTPFFDPSLPDTEINAQGVQVNNQAKNWSFVRYNAYFENDAGNIALGKYFSTKTNTIDYQIEQIDDLGFDFVVADLTNGVGEGKQGAINFITRLETLSTAQGSSIDLEFAAAMGGPLWKPQYDAYGQLITGSALNQLVQNEADAVWNELVMEAGTSIQRSSYFEVEDGAGVLRPLMLTYMDYDNQNYLPFPLWYDFRFVIERATGLVSNDNPNLDFVDNGYNWNAWWGWLSESQVLSPSAMLISPGFDTDHFKGAGAGVTKDRMDGAVYTDQWLTAIAEDPDFIIVSSWNDYNEETHIEPCEPILSWISPITDTPNPPLPFLDINGFQTSDLYRQHTRAYLALRDNTLIEGFYYTDNNTPNIYVVDGPDLVLIGALGQIAPNSAVVTLPVGVLDPILNGAVSTVWLQQ